MYCFAKICCLCLEPDENILKLDVNICTNGSNIEKIFTLLPFYNKIYGKMQIPEWLCEKCKENIDQFYIFYKNCLKSSKLLKLYYLKLNKYENTTIKTETFDEDFLKFIKTDNSEDEYDVFFKEESIDIIKTELTLNEAIKSETIIKEDLSDNLSQFESQSNDDNTQISFNPELSTISYNTSRTSVNNDISPNRTFTISPKMKIESNDVMQVILNSEFSTDVNINENKRASEIIDTLSNKKFKNSSQFGYISYNDNEISTLIENNSNRKIINIPREKNLILTETINNSTLSSNDIIENGESVISKIPLNNIVYNTFKYRDKNDQKSSSNVNKQTNNKLPIILNEYMNLDRLSKNYEMMENKKKRLKKKAILLEKPSRRLVSLPTPSVASDMNTEESSSTTTMNSNSNNNYNYFLSINENTSNEIIEINESDSNDSEKTIPDIDIIPISDDSPDIPENNNNKTVALLDKIDLTSNKMNSNKGIDKISVSKNASIAIEISSFIDQIIGKCKKLKKENLSTDPNIEMYNLTFVSNLNGATEIISVHRDNELSKISVTRGANIDTIAISKIADSFVITHKSENIYCKAENQYQRKNLNHLITDLCNSLTTSQIDTATTIDLTKEEKSTARNTQCRMCAIEFHDTMQLGDHMNRHVDARKLMCLVCDKRFSNMLDLNKHIKIHFYFSTSFQQKTNHIDIHTSDFIHTDTSSSNHYDYNFHFIDNENKTIFNRNSKSSSSNNHLIQFNKK